MAWSFRGSLEEARERALEIVGKIPFSFPEDDDDPELEAKFHDTITADFQKLVQDLDTEPCRSDAMKLLRRIHDAKQKLSQEFSYDVESILYLGTVFDRFAERAIGAWEQRQSQGRESNQVRKL